MIALGFILPMIGGGFLMRKFITTIQQQQASLPQPSRAVPARPEVTVLDVPAAVARAQKEIRELADSADKYRLQTGRYPEDTESLYAMWRLEHPRDPELRDPFDATRYAYLAEDGEYDIWSSGEERKDMKARLRVTSGESVRLPEKR